jgi:hypothetical protein
VLSLKLFWVIAASDLRSGGCSFGLLFCSTSFQWDAVESEFGEQTIHLISTLSAFRKRQKELLQRICFLEAGMLTWHGIQPKKPRWQSSDRFQKNSLPDPFDFI